MCCGILIVQSQANTLHISLPFIKWSKGVVRKNDKRHYHATEFIFSGTWRMYKVRCSGVQLKGSKYCHRLFFIDFHWFQCPLELIKIFQNHWISLKSNKLIPMIVKMSQTKPSWNIFVVLLRYGQSASLMW